MAQIFLMEDSPALRRVLSHQLRDAGHDVTPFENGDASRDRGLVAMADLLVTDLDMPRIDGAAAIRNVRRLRPDLPVIVVTGVDPREAPVPPGVACVLRKPFDAAALSEAVDRALASRNESQDETGIESAPVFVTAPLEVAAPPGVDPARLSVALAKRLRRILSVGRGGK